MTDATFDLSVVVGCKDAAGSIRACLDGLLEQSDRISCQIIVVDASRDGCADIVERHYPQVEIIRADPRSWVNNLWSIGIAHASAPIVALTSGRCIAESSWAESILRAHDGKPSLAAVGGVFELRRPAGLVGWAVYFCRYAAHMPPLPAGEVLEIAADNGSYKRDVLVKHAAAIAEGFWEPVLHAAIRDDGFRLSRDPGIRVHYASGVGFWQFARQRFAHGKIFAELRSAGSPRSERLYRIALAPLVPALMTGRLAGHIARRPQYLLPLLLSLPLTTAFFCCWATGEWVGFLGGERAAGRSRPKTVEGTPSNI